MPKFIKLKNYEGLRFIRQDLIESIEVCVSRMYFHDENARTVDVESVLYYNRGNSMYFEQDAEAVERIVTAQC